MLAELTDERLKREGIAAETIRMGLMPIVETEFEQALLRLDKATEINGLLDARADLRVIRAIMRQLNHKYRLYKD